LDYRATLQAVLGAVEDGVIVTDTAGRVIAFNRAAEALTGWPATDATGQPVIMVLRDPERARPEPRSPLPTGSHRAIERAIIARDGARKRIRQQTEESIRIQREELLRDLLAIIDNLERAVDAARGGGNGKPIVEGIEMVLRSMHDLLKSHGVTAITAVGKPFDPLMHEAVDHVETEQYEPNTVIKEFHRGYQIGDRLLRPARVSVSKALDPQGESGDQGGNGPDVEKP